MQPEHFFPDVPAPLPDEVFQELLQGGEFRLERIISTGQATPPDLWYDQPQAEWVILLSGAARLVFEDQPEPVELRPGDYVNIPPHCRHRVQWTDPQQTSIWLALHYAPRTGPNSPSVMPRPDDRA